jgi:hypothetical protein
VYNCTVFRKQSTSSAVFHVLRALQWHLPADLHQLDRRLLLRALCMRRTTPSSGGPEMTRFSLTIEGSSEQPGIHGLRAILKDLLRRHGFRCVDAKENPHEAEAPPDVSGTMKDD